MKTRKDEIIWNNVKRLMNERGWNQSRLAKEINSPPQSLNNIKTGTVGIGPRMLKKFAGAFQVTENELLSVESIAKFKPIEINKETLRKYLNSFINRFCLRLY